MLINVPIRRFCNPKREHQLNEHLLQNKLSFAKQKTFAFYTKPQCFDNFFVFLIF